MSLLGPLLMALLGTTTRFLTIFFIFLTPPFFTADDDAVPFIGGRFDDLVEAAAPPRVVNSGLFWLLLCAGEVEPADEGEDGKFQGSRGERKMPRPLEFDCTALTTQSAIEAAATRQTHSAVAV